MTCPVSGRACHCRTPCADSREAAEREVARVCTSLPCPTCKRPANVFEHRGILINAIATAGANIAALEEQFKRLSKDDMNRNRLERELEQACYHRSKLEELV